MESVIVNILLFILVIGTLTFVHELGHFVAAKIVGAKVFEFALGFGPKLISKKFKGTQYSIRLFPLGGYVKILGDGDPGKEDSKSNPKGNLSKKPKVQQIFVMLAGVTMNILLAILFYYIVLGASGWKLVIGSEFEKFNAMGGELYRERMGDVEYLEVLDGGGAQKAAIPEKGKIVSIQGQDIKNSDEVGLLLWENRGQNVSMEICVDQECKEYLVGVSSEGKVGISLPSNYLVILSYEDNRLIAGPVHLVNTLRLIWIKFGEIINKAQDTGDYTELSNSVSGPVGIYFVIDYFKDFGLIPFLSIMADLSLSLAIVNLLPIPALDGGRVFILTIEGLLRKNLDERVEALIINISFGLLIVLIVFVIIKDIVNIESLKNMFM